LTQLASEPIEKRLRDSFANGDLRATATQIMEAYGGEVYSFLAARLRDPEMTADVFGDFTEDLWRGLATFRWDCSARAWTYTIARHAASRGIRRWRRRGARCLPLSRAGPLSQIAERIRTGTSLALQTSKRNRIAELRERLPEVEQTLLMLRVNRELPWREIARIMAAGSRQSALELGPDELDAEAARLRKRFQKAKEKLRRMAQEIGLLSDQ
jgi:RNA polymerase sigma-70 factor (ECF subfamily)